MNDTGRIHSPLPAALRRIVFGQSNPDEMNRELTRLAAIDRAHTLMLIRAGLLEPNDGRAVLDVIDRMEANRFAEFRDLEPTRGIYLLWESQLCGLLGERIGGAIHLARSRNDINATMIRMQLRDALLPVLFELVRLRGALLRAAVKGIDTLSVGYTHLQPAMPLTVAHQLAGWSAALGRDVQGVFDSTRDLDRLPLGAGAVGGTSLPINPFFTAELLGFREPVLNSLDAVASRDFVLRILSAMAVAAVTMSRFAADLQHWVMNEVGFAKLPDELVGSSSQMPQKRNPFLLEIIQSRAMSAVGAFVTACTRMHAAPFSNSVAVGTEGICGIAETLRDVAHTACIFRHVVLGLQFQPEVMRWVAEKSFVNATALADRLVRDDKLSFREAHRAVGQMVNESITRGCSLLDVAGERTTADLTALDARSVAFGAKYGGGPSPVAVERQLEALRCKQHEFLIRLRYRRRRIRTATRKLSALCRSVGRAPVAMETDL